MRPVPLRGLALAVASSSLLSGCVFAPSHEAFAADANKACEKSANRIAQLSTPADPQDAIGYAIDVYLEKDRLLTQLTRMRLPHDDAAALRTRWLDPARQDLADLRPHLDAIRQAVRQRDSDRVRAELDALVRTSADGVDDALLSEHGLTHCREVFGTPAR